MVNIDTGATNVCDTPKVGFVSTLIKLAVLTTSVKNLSLVVQCCTLIELSPIGLFFIDFQQVESCQRNYSVGSSGSCKTLFMKLI